MVHVKDLGDNQPYLAIWEQMKSFTLQRHPLSLDECWLLEHQPVFTQGQAGKAEHLLKSTAIPLIQSDRGGQITYHGPGQLVAYLLIDLRRRELNIRTFVNCLEQLLIKLLDSYGIDAQSRCHAPGVYIAEKKIASIGLRVKNGCTYHGIALNVDMDLKPFNDINPCGFSQLQMTRMLDFMPDITMTDVKSRLSSLFITQFRQA